MAFMRLTGFVSVMLLAASAACSSDDNDEGNQTGGPSGAGGGAAGSAASGGVVVEGGLGGNAGDAGSAGYAGTVVDSGGNDAASDGSLGDGSDFDAGVHTPDAFVEMAYAGKYAGIESLTGAALAAELCQRVVQGYQSMSYTAARQVVFLKTDNHAGKVLGVYDGFWHDPTHTTINIEHTWPQSKGADTLPARSDLHHLFPVQANFNSARSNLPFGEVVQRDWPATLEGDAGCLDAMPGNLDGCYSIKGKDAFGVQVFEPRDGHKGDAARAVFYFSIRYGIGCAVKSLSIFDPQHPTKTEEVLKKWNLHDPPSDHERQRNDVIEIEEGVRNPFIDHPELVDEISFQ
jgi:endonuclease I